jgi:hypothetical protein
MNREAQIKAMLERQAAWQRSRAALSWEEKLRQSLAMRAARQALRGSTADRRPVRAGRPPEGEPPRRLRAS